MTPVYLYVIYHTENKLNEEIDRHKSQMRSAKRDFYYFYW